MDDKQIKEQEKREVRRKRRVRNQIIAYISIFAFLIGIATGIFFAGKFALDKYNEKKEKEASQVVIEEEELPPEDIVISEPEPVEVEKTEQEKMDEIVNAAIEVMTLEDKVAGLFMVTPEAITGVTTAIKAGEGTKEALSKYAIGGVIYFSKNIESSDQLTEMINNTKMWSKYPLFIATDEEGGKVSRIAESSIEVNKVGSPAEIAATNDQNKALEAGSTIASYMTALGFNFDFAPVADVTVGSGAVLGDRSYGSDTGLVSSMVTNMITGLQGGGISSCMKHFPGLGDTTEDTHEGMSVSERTKEEYQNSDFLVFQSGISAGVDSIMVSHLSAPSLTGDNTPCSLSSAVVTDILRTELGYDGIIITDAMNMKAITEYYEADEAAILALKAGCDMILMPDDFEKAYQGIIQAVQDGTISEERINDALRRIYRVKLRGTIDNYITP